MSTSPAASEPPSPPPALTKKNKTGAIAAVKYFLESLNYAGETGDTQPFRKTFNNFCTRCDAIADGIERTYGAGGKITGAAWTGKDFTFYGILRGVAVVDASVDISPETFQESAESEPRKSPGQEKVLKAFQLEWAMDDGWVVAALDPEG